MTETSAAELLRQAADLLENPPIRPGMIVRYVYDEPTSPVWERRKGREFLVVHVDIEDALHVWVPGSHEDDPLRHDRIGSYHDRWAVIVPERDKALAAFLRSTADRTDSGNEISAGRGLWLEPAVTVAHAVIAAAQVSP
jgi:hypothetical protein